MAQPTTSQGWLDLYKFAEYQILTFGKSNALNGAMQTQEDLPEIRRGRKEYERKVRAEAYSAAGGGPFRFVRADFS